MANEDAPSFSVDSQRLWPNLDGNDSVEASRRIDMPLPRRLCPRVIESHRGPVLVPRDGGHSRESAPRR